MIYLDNAATSFHKPDCVPRAVVEGTISVQIAWIFQPSVRRRR